MLGLKPFGLFLERPSRSDAMNQILAMARYIQDRYGSIEQWRAHPDHPTYASGGLVRSPAPLREEPRR